MRQRICIGIQNLTRDWQIVLDTIGLAYEQIEYSKLSVSEYSVLIFNKKPEVEQLPLIFTFLQNSGAVLEVDDVHVFHSSASKKRLYRSTIVNNSNDPAYKHILQLDVFSSVYLHQQSDILEGVVHFKREENGFSAFLGLNVPELLNHTGYRRKRFFNPTGVYPDEIVNDISKHKVLQIFEEVLKELHFQRELPFVKKWTSPSKKPVFGFRIDSDYGDQASLSSIYTLAKKHKLSLSWFLHVEAHEDWLNYFTELENQEIALHGYKHGTSKSTKKIRSNISKGAQKLMNAGFQTSGYCAPYGIWNKNLSKALADFNFSYSSEFTYAYDCCPLQPFNENLPLQIPIHPICTGSLNRKGLSLAEMKAYFEFVFNNKLSRYEPVFFYHHPLQVGIECVDYLFKRAHSEKLTNLSFSEYAAFWMNRKFLKPDIYVEHEKIYLENADADYQWLQVFSDINSFALFPAKNGTYALTNSPEFEYSKQYLPEPEQIMELRKSDLKFLKTSILDWKNRKKL